MKKPVTPFDVLAVLGVLAVLVAFTLLTSGCLHRSPNRYDATTGRVVSEGGFTAFLVRGEADKMTESFVQTGTNSTRRVSIGGLKAETELDKASVLLESAAAGLARGAKP